MRHADTDDQYIIDRCILSVKDSGNARPLVFGESEIIYKDLPTIVAFDDNVKIIDGQYLSAGIV